MREKSVRLLSVLALVVVTTAGCESRQDKLDASADSLQESRASLESGAGDMTPEQARKTRELLEDVRKIEAGLRRQAAFERNAKGR